MNCHFRVEFPPDTCAPFVRTCIVGGAVRVA